MNEYSLAKVQLYIYAAARDERKITTAAKRDSPSMKAIRPSCILSIPKGWTRARNSRTKRLDFNVLFRIWLIIMFCIS